MEGDQHHAADYAPGGGGNKELRFHMVWNRRASHPAVEERALARRAAGSSVAENPAWRDAGVSGDFLQRKAVRKTRPRFPGAHHRNADVEIAGNCFLGQVLAEAPVFQDRAEVRPKSAGRIHGTFLAPNAGREKLFLPALPGWRFADVARAGENFVRKRFHVAADSRGNRRGLRFLSAQVFA